MIAALTKIGGTAPLTVWQTDTQIPPVDLIVIPGGFSYGDYLRCGAIAARTRLDGGRSGAVVGSGRRARAVLMREASAAGPRGGLAGGYVECHV